MTRPRVVAVILAAGLGTRMRSQRAKVLHPMGGLPLVTWVVRAVRPLVQRTVVVVGHQRDAVRAALEGEDVRIAVQEEQRGTAHALLSARHELAEADVLLVLAGDVPRLRTESLAGLLREHEAQRAAATMLTFRAGDPTGYGRVVRDAAGTVRAIVEHVQADEAQRRIDEVNAALYALDASETLGRLEALPVRRGGETWLTDVVEALVEAGRTVAAVEVPEAEVAGINTQAQLAEAEARYREERSRGLRDAGVTLIDPVSIDADADVAPGAIVGPFVALEGRTKVGAGCVVGPLVRLRDASLGDGCRLTGPLAIEGQALVAGTVRSGAD